MQFSWEKFRG